MKPIRLKLGFAFIATALSLLGVVGVPVSASPQKEPPPVTLDDDEASRRKLALVMIDALRRGGDGGPGGGGVFASAPASAKLVGVAQDGFLRLYGRGNQKVAFYVAIAGAGFDRADPAFPGGQLGPFAAGAYGLAAQELGGQSRWVSLNTRCERPPCVGSHGGISDAGAENVFMFAVNMGGLGANRGGLK